jgi:hypothetical protein
MPAQHDCTLQWSDADMAELAGQSFQRLNMLMPSFA